MRLVIAPLALGLLLTGGTWAAGCADHGEAPGLATSRDPGASAEAAAAARVADVRRRFVLAPPAARPRQGPGAPERAAIGPSMVQHWRAPAGGRMAAEIMHGAKKRVLRSASVELPVSAEGAALLTDDRSGVSIAFGLEGARATPVETTGDGVALYRGATREGADVIHRVHAEGAEDFVVFESKPRAEELSYRVDVSRVPGIRLVENVLEFVDADGTPVLRVAPPYVVSEGGEVTPARLAVDGCAYDIDPAGPWGRPVTPPGARSCRVRVAWHAASYPALVDPAWVATGSMTTGRMRPTATRLVSGKVLIAGGSGTSGNLASAELFDGTSTFAATGSMSVGRSEHTATLLPTGKVLVAGGPHLASAELFDGTSSFAATGSMTVSRAVHTATLLGSGKVLLAGGSASSGYVASAELFDGTSSFAGTGSMSTVRYLHTATLLPSGAVLIAGGDDGGNVLASAELFDGTSTFSATGSLTSARYDAVATLLASGEVLITGGVGSSGYLARAELFDGTSTFAVAGLMTVPRDSQTATLLGSGDVLIAGGVDGGDFSSAELFDGTSSFAGTASMGTGRFGHTATLLPSGKVLVSGGTGPLGQILASAELLFSSVPGSSCGSNSECASGSCEGGICCKAACPNGGVCRACAAISGACVTIAGDDPEGCTGSKTCSAAGSCLLKAGQPSTDGAACATGFAVDGVCCDSACDQPCESCAAALGASVDGTCTVATEGAAGSPACAPFACDGASVACPASCAADGECSAGQFCASDSSCKPQVAQGGACDAADCVASPCRECGSGSCVDGVCCAAARCSTCEACSAAFQAPGGTNGVCSPARADSDPHDDCAPSVGFPADCLADGRCDGHGACRPYANDNVACGATTCNGNAVVGLVCSGAGSCESSPGASCAPYACGGGRCNTSCAIRTDCIDATYYCSHDATCLKLLEAGASCDDDSQCVDGLCVDGTCCTSTCAGPCEACNVGGHAGTCYPVEAGPSPKDGCTGAGPCASACDGQSGVCVVPVGKSCGTACASAEETDRACAASGACGAALSHACAGNLRCDAAGEACLATCGNDADCARGFRCGDGGACVPGSDPAPAAIASEGGGCSVVGRGDAAPLPTSAALLALGAVGLCGRRRRRPGSRPRPR